ncbi:MAG TPA: CHASE3 domain-containing protein, partial [Rhodanobacter sp.]|nr:CHASE3 domain-containing protein [Rhodanobacter sp.]
MKANKWILLAAVPVLLVMAAVLYITFTFADNERRQQGWVVHTYQVMDSLRVLLNDAADAETGQRGYLLTHNPSFLEPYHEARGRIGTDLERFAGLTRDNPVQQKRVAELRKLIYGRLELLDKGVANAALSTPVPPALLSVLEQGKAAMDALRTAVAMGLEDEQKLLKMRTEARRSVEQAEILAAVLAVILALGVLFAAAALLVRNNTRLAVSEAIRRRQANILQATLDNIRDGVLVFDETDRVSAFNNVFFRLMDFPERLASIGATLDVFKKYDAGQGRRDFGDVTPSKQDHDNHYDRFARKERELDVYAAEIPGEGFLVAAADVTARVRAEATVRQAQKMEAVGHLTGGVAHDFNNLLQIISANLDLASADAKHDPKTAERLQNAISAVERGSRLTAQLLAFARRQALEPRSTNVGRLLGD